MEQLNSNNENLDKLSFYKRENIHKECLEKHNKKEVMNKNEF